MKRVLLAIALLLGLMALPPLARSLDEVGGGRDPHDPNLFQFVRIRYHGYLTFGRSFGQPPWMHDYPRAEHNFLKILLEVTSIPTTTESFLILDLDDPRIMNYPILYVSEPGYWDITRAEAKNLREYLLRGGFVIFDDFRSAPEWGNLTGAMKQVLPERSFQRLTLEHPIFHCFYDIKTLHMTPPYVLPGQGETQFQGILDEEGRLLVIADYNNDIGDFWEWSDDPLTPIPLSNEAFKFGINYIIYGMSH